MKKSTVRYAIVIEKARKNYAAYVPDLPGCVATGATVEETERLIREAIELHLRGMEEDGLPIPKPASQVEYIELSA
jgi:predicted RNase H-like HicB family nuclease